MTKLTKGEMLKSIASAGVSAKYLTFLATHNREDVAIAFNTLANDMKN